MNTVGYIRVSTEDQCTEKNKADILMFAHKNGLGIVNFVEEKVSGKKSWKDRKICSVISSMGEKDNLIVPELSRLGRSMLEIMEILSIAKQKNINIYSVKGNWRLDESIQSKIIAMAFSMAAEIERDLISSRTKEALRAVKAKGVKLGRPKGPGKSKLDQYHDEIMAFVATGSTQVWLSKKYNVSKSTMCNWLKRRKHGKKC
jgi:DNA invertase Pin-like site-specific DNA recombinase